MKKYLVKKVVGLFFLSATFSCGTDASKDREEKSISKDNLVEKIGKINNKIQKLFLETKDCKSKNIIKGDLKENKGKLQILVDDLEKGKKKLEAIEKKSESDEEALAGVVSCLSLAKSLIEDIDSLIYESVKKTGIERDLKNKKEDLKEKLEDKKAEQDKEVEQDKEEKEGENKSEEIVNLLKELKKEFSDAQNIGSELTIFMDVNSLKEKEKKIEDSTKKCKDSLAKFEGQEKKEIESILSSLEKIHEKVKLFVIVSSRFFESLKSDPSKKEYKEFDEFCKRGDPVRLANLFSKIDENGGKNNLNFESIKGKISLNEIYRKEDCISIVECDDSVCFVVQNGGAFFLILQYR